MCVRGLPSTDAADIPSRCNPCKPVRSTVQRPSLKIHGSWAMGVSAVTTLSQVGFCTGWALNLYVMDESCAHDASAICEILGLTLEEIQRISKATGKPMPTTLLLCSDNTVREAKNQHVMQMLIALASKFKMKVTGLLNLRKSHTHTRSSGSAVGHPCPSRCKCRQVPKP